MVFLVMRWDVLTGKELTKVSWLRFTFINPISPSPFPSRGKEEEKNLVVPRDLNLGPLTHQIHDPVCQANLCDNVYLYNPGVISLSLLLC